MSAQEPGVVAEVEAPCTAREPVSGTTRAAWRIEGLDCPDCARSVGAAVERIPGVTCVDLNYASATLLVDYKASAAGATEIVETILAAGYGAAPLDETAAGAPARERSWLDRNLAEVATLGAGVFTVLGGLLGVLSAPDVASDLAFAVAIGFGGLLVWRRAWMSVKARVLDMNVLMTVAVVGAALLGEWGEGATVYFLFALGGLLESRSLERTRRSIRDLMSLAPESVRVIRAGVAEEVAVEQARLGEVFIVRPGERIALDGVVIAGDSAVDEAAITGESIPAEKSPGDRVFSGTLNASGLLQIEATAVGADSTLARIVYLVEEAQASRAPSQTLVDRFSRWYTPSVIALAGIVAVVPPLVGLMLGVDAVAWSEWVRRALVLLVVSCPCALVISTPVSIVSGITRASRDGVLVKGGAFLEAAADIDAIAFDKTGTLTHGRPQVVELVVFGQLEEGRALMIAAALESHSNHPIARAVVRAAQGVSLPEPERFAETPGVGVSGVLEGRAWRLVSPSGAQEQGTSLPGEVAAVVEAAEAAGRTALVLQDDGATVAVLSVADTVRPEVASVIRSLNGMGVKHLVMLTGDNERVAESIAEQVGLSSFLARLLPEAKTDAVRALKQRYHRVAMVGDGVNDAPALAAADISIAMGAAGSDTALETADVALMRDDLTSLPGFIALGRRTVSTIKTNVAFSILVKVIFVALALTGRATLWMAVFADTGVSLLVILNGMRLLRKTS